MLSTRLRLVSGIFVCQVGPVKLGASFTGQQSVQYCFTHYVTDNIEQLNQKRLKIPYDVVMHFSVCVLTSVDITKARVKKKNGHIRGSVAVAEIKVKLREHLQW